MTKYYDTERIGHEVISHVYSDAERTKYIKTELVDTLYVSRGSVAAGDKMTFVWRG